MVRNAVRCFLAGLLGVSIIHCTSEHGVDSTELAEFGSVGRPDDASSELDGTDRDDTVSVAVAAPEPWQRIGFDAFAFIGAETSACDSNGFEHIENCYNRFLPPPPSMMRSAVQPTGPHWSTERIDTQSVKAYGAPQQSPHQTYALPNHRSSTDGRLVTYNRGRPKGVAMFHPENLSHGLQTMADPERPVLSGHTALRPWMRANPLPGESRYPAHMFTQNIAKHAGNLDLCSKNGSDSMLNPRRCRARANDSEPWREGDCYDQTVVWSHNHYDTVESIHRWEIRSLDLVFFVPFGKAAHTGQSDDDETIWIFPEALVDDYHALPDYDAFRWETWISDSQWHDVDILRERALQECLGPGTHPAWCTFLTSQKALLANEDFWMEGFGDWDGTTFEQAFLEPSITADGMVMIIHNVNGVMYSFNEAGACDASGWQDFNHISSAHLDSRVNQRYGFARYPVRDTQGEMYEPGMPVQGGYPWIDRKGDNIFFPAAFAQDGYKIRFPEAMTYRDAYEQEVSVQADELVDPKDFNVGNMRGIVAVGSWTRGKTVLLDGGLNLTDFRTPRYDLQSVIWKLQLFDSNDSTRFRPAGIHKLSSFENQLNQYTALNPISPFDVVWLMNSNINHNAEVVFDEYMHPDALVVAHMNAPLRTRWYQSGGIQRADVVEDNGFRSAYECDAEAEDYRFVESPKLQNASTMENAPSLRLLGGAWVPPLAVGGVKGKGVYLDGANDHILVEDILEAPTDYYLGLWLDNRAGGQLRRTLLQTESGESIRLNARSIQIGDLVQSIPEVGVGVYTHFGFAIYNSRRLIDIFINGTYYATFKAGLDLGQRFSIGARDHHRARPIHGWVDELRLYKLQPELKDSGTQIEMFCNHALGSMRWYRQNTLAQLWQKTKYLNEGRRGLKYAYACDQLDIWSTRRQGADHMDDGLDFPLAAYTNGSCGASVHRNAGPNCHRSRLLEVHHKPLIPFEPRPDFSEVAFCTSCHVSESDPVPGLRPSALDAGHTSVQYDARRQPMSWPRMVFGSPPSLGDQLLLPITALDVGWWDVQILEHGKIEPVEQVGTLPPLLP